MYSFDNICNVKKDNHSEQKMRVERPAALPAALLYLCIVLILLLEGQKSVNIARSN